MKNKHEDLVTVKVEQKKEGTKEGELEEQTREYKRVRLHDFCPMKCPKTLLPSDFYCGFFFFFFSFHCHYSLISVLETI